MEFRGLSMDLPWISVDFSRRFRGSHESHHYCCTSQAALGNIDPPRNDGISGFRQFREFREFIFRGLSMDSPWISVDLP